MKRVIYHCPTKGDAVEHWIDPDKESVNLNPFKAMLCPACQGIHMINMVTGKALGEKSDDARKKQ
jgi:hypothetical protein